MAWDGGPPSPGHLHLRLTLPGPCMPHSPAPNVRPLVSNCGRRHGPDFGRAADLGAGLGADLDESRSRLSTRDAWASRRRRQHVDAVAKRKGLCGNGHEEGGRHRRKLTKPGAQDQDSATPARFLLTTVQGDIVGMACVWVGSCARLWPVFRLFAARATETLSYYMRAVFYWRL